MREFRGANVANAANAAMAPKSAHDIDNTEVRNALWKETWVFFTQLWPSFPQRGWPASLYPSKWPKAGLEHYD